MVKIAVAGRQRFSANIICFTRASGCVPLTSIPHVVLFKSPPDVQQIDHFGTHDHFGTQSNKSDFVRDCFQKPTPS